MLLQIQPGMTVSFDELDANHDGVIDRAEFEGGLYQVLSGRIDQKLLAQPIQSTFGRLSVISYSIWC